MTLQHWLKMTDGGTFSTRSSSLKRVDLALAQHGAMKSPATLAALRTALISWMGEKGSDWKSSIRNKHHAVDDLHRQVMNLPELKKSGEEMVGLSEVMREQQLLLDKLFLHAKLSFKPGYLSLLGKQARDTKINAGMLQHQIKGLTKTKTTATRISSGITANGLFSSLLEPVAAAMRDEVKRIVLEIMPGVLVQLAAEIAPCLGIITSGGSALVGYITLAKSQYQLDQMQMHQERMLVLDNPAKALDAIVVVFRRERNAVGAAAAINTAAFGVKAAGFFLDLGSATSAVAGLASTIAKLAITIRTIVRDITERNEANRLMLHPIQVSIFKECPIIGAYYVCCAPTSVLVNAVFTRWWKHGVKGEIERNVAHHVAPVRESARALIKDYRFEITTLKRFPGVLAENSDNLKAMEKNKGKSGMDSISGPALTAPRTG